MNLYEDYDMSKTISGVVKKSLRITSESVDEVREIDVSLCDIEGTFQVGQNIGIKVPGPHEFGNPEHVRLYSVANTYRENNNLVLQLCVKRCFYIDDYSGEQFPGIASNYLCDLSPGAVISVAGPFGLAFEIPENKDANLLLIGMGTGIAPFRAFIKHIYKEIGGWQGKVRLFYGARSGLELLYMNDKNDDLTNYYDEESFKAFEAVSPRPHLDDPVALDGTLEQNREEVWELIRDPDTYVYVAGLEKVHHLLDKAFIKMASTEEKWTRRKAELIAGKRWVELTY